MDRSRQFWRELRLDFQTLERHEFSILWDSEKPLTIPTYEVLPSHWSWWRYPDSTMRLLLESFAFRGGKAIGGKDEDSWFDQLRIRGIGFQQNGNGLDTVRKTNGEVTHWVSGQILNLVQASIALCATMEAQPKQSDAGPKFSIAKLKELQGNRSQETFAEDLGISVNTLKSWSRKRPKHPEMETIRLIAKRSGVDPSYLLE